MMDITRYLTPDWIYSLHVVLGAALLAVTALFTLVETLRRRR